MKPTTLIRRKPAVRIACWVFVALGLAALVSTGCRDDRRQITEHQRILDAERD